MFLFSCVYLFVFICWTVFLYFKWIKNFSHLFKNRNSWSVYSCDKAETIVYGCRCSLTSTVFGSGPMLYVKKRENKKERNFSRQSKGRKTQEETIRGGLQDRCSPQGEPPLTRLPHKLFCTFRLHSKVVELGYKIISQATCLSSLTVQLANWRTWQSKSEWFSFLLSFLLSHILSILIFWIFFLSMTSPDKLHARGEKKSKKIWLTVSQIDK